MLKFSSFFVDTAQVVL